MVTVFGPVELIVWTRIQVAVRLSGVSCSTWSYKQSQVEGGIHHTETNWQPNNNTVSDQVSQKYNAWWPENYHLSSVEEFHN